MSNYSTQYKRRCWCGKIFETTDTEMAKGSGRYCGDGCLEKFLEDSNGRIYLSNYKPKGADENSRTYKACVWFSYPKYTRYEYRHLDYSVVGNPKDKNLYKIVWEGPEAVKYSRDLPSPVSSRELEILFNVVFKKSPEAMFQAFLIAGKDELEMYHLQAVLIS